MAPEAKKKKKKSYEHVNGHLKQDTTRPPPQWREMTCHASVALMFVVTRGVMETGCGVARGYPVPILALVW